jgi:hypothetical protein
MRVTSPPTLRPSEEFAETAARVLTGERQRLRDHGIPGELVLIGGTSVPGALTRGDVDLHLRVAPSDFADAVAALRTLHPVVHAEIWQPTLATFDVGAAVPAGLAVTPVGSEHDVRFTTTWRRLAAEPQLLQEHNAVKLAGAVGDADYERRKSEFFDRVVAGAGDEPPGPG